MEEVVLVDSKNNVVGYMEKMEAHQKGLLHRAFSVFVFNSNNELCFCLSTHTAKSRKGINDLKKILPIMLSAANNLKKVLFKD